MSEDIDFYEEVSMKRDNINPDHYQTQSLECIEVIESMGMVTDFCRGNVIKYVYRYKNKNGVEDLKKAAWYLNYLIEHEERING